MKPSDIFDIQSKALQKLIDVYKNRQIRSLKYMAAMTCITSNIKIVDVPSELKIYVHDINNKFKRYITPKISGNKIKKLPVSRFFPITDDFVEYHSWDDCQVLIRSLPVLIEKINVKNTINRIYNDKFLCPPLIKEDIGLCTVDNYLYKIYHGTLIIIILVRTNILKRNPYCDPPLNTYQNRCHLKLLPAIYMKNPYV